MLRRPPARLAALAAAVILGLAARPAACAGSSVTVSKAYTLTNNSGSTIDHVFIGFEPIGAVTEPPGGGKPLILQSAPEFDGITPDFGIFNFQTSAGGPTQQALGLDFKGTAFGFLTTNPPPVPADGGLKPGDSVTFKLNLDSVLADQLKLTLMDPPPSSGLDFGPADALGGGSGGGAGGGGDPIPPINTPEPLPVLVWSALAGLGLARVHFHRRSRKLAA